MLGLGRTVRDIRKTKSMDVLLSENPISCDRGQKAIFQTAKANRGYLHTLCKMQEITRCRSSPQKIAGRDKEG